MTKTELWKMWKILRHMLAGMLISACIPAYMIVKDDHQQRAFEKSLSVDQLKHYHEIVAGLNSATTGDLLVTRTNDVYMVTAPRWPEGLPFKASPSDREQLKAQYLLGRSVARIAHQCDSDFAELLARFKNRV